MASVAERFSEPEAHVETRDEKAYSRMLYDYLAPATMLLGLLIGLAFFRLPYPVAEEVADHLALEESEARMIIPPLARLLDKQRFSTRVKVAIQSSGDYIGLSMGLGAYLLRTTAIMQEVSRQLHGQSSGQIAEQAIRAASNGHQQPAAAPAQPNYGYINAGGLLG